MSIIAKIQKHIAAGTLYRYEPAFVPIGFQREREVLMTEEAHQQCPPKGNPKIGNLKGLAHDNARAALEAFIGGDLVHENLHIKLLKPIDRHVWAIRILQQPQHRLFGYFIGPDSYLITHSERRDKLDSRWDREIEKCVRKRERLFQDLPPYVSGLFIDYVTRNGVQE